MTVEQLSPSELRAVLDQVAQRYAHGSRAHRAVVRRTRPEQWYAEELFARLAVTSVTGTHRGVAP